MKSIKVVSILSLIFVLIVSCQTSSINRSIASPASPKEDSCVTILKSLFKKKKNGEDWNALSNIIVERFKQSIANGGAQRLSSDAKSNYLEKQKLFTGHVKMMRELGIIIEEDRIFIPDVQEIFNRYKKFMLTQTEEISEFREEHIILPKFLFTSKNGDPPIALEFGEPIPSGYDIAVGNGIINSKLWTDFLVKSELIMGHVGEIANGITSFEHDLGHLTSFMEDPLYGRDIIESYKKLRLPKDERNGAVSNLTRGAHTFEYLDLIKPEYKNIVADLSLLPPGKTPENVSYDEVLEYIKSLKYDDFIKLHNKFAEVKPEALLVLGGSGRDMHTAQTVLTSDHMGVVKVFQEDDFADSRREQAARMHFKMIKFTLLSREDFFDLALRKDTPASSPIFKYICSDQKWKELDSELFFTYCLQVNTLKPN